MKDHRDCSVYILIMAGFDMDAWPMMQLAARNHQTNAASCGVDKSQSECLHELIKISLSGFLSMHIQSLKNKLKLQPRWACYKCSDKLLLNFMARSLSYQCYQLHCAWMNLLIVVLEALPFSFRFIKYEQCSCGEYFKEEFWNE